ncbi:NADPH2:quinone reductase [Actinomycetospora succinea]|uniref:NADPH2:quinone reductase n=1 Tax=Actinomycetospora succinea TaxID=663603 RepID=A0A4R6VE50_9PSEU|nr:NADPH:quinone oxidoreductase family protein [Actinomycetospora succinea]TDQ58758.1 NADPH2:quinone reductase [Actinomycetospora succinea]
MRRVLCREFGPTDRLELVEEPDPVPGPGQVVVAVEAAGASFVDALIVRGGYQLRPELPFTPGTAVAGRIAAVGEGVDKRFGGCRVAALMMGFGAYASHVVVPAEDVAPLSEDVDAALAATALESYSTLLFATTHRVPITAGERVVVLGAGGGIGLAAVDVAHGLGARVLAVASSEDKRRAAREAGAEHAIGYDGLKDGIRAHTDGGADIVIDPVGGDAAEQALRALRPFGRYAVLGFTAGEIPRLPANRVLIGNRTVVGVDWGDWARTSPAAATALVSDLLARTDRGELHPPSPARHPLEEAGAVLARFAERAVTGKIALIP